MKIGRNDLCYCGSGKKYKKCCLNKDKSTSANTEVSSFTDPFAYHNNYIHTREVKSSKINKELLNIYDNRDKLSTKEIIDSYLKVMNYVLDYAAKNKIYTIEELDEEELVGDFLTNIIGEFELEISNLDIDEYDLNITNNYIDKLIKTLKLDDNNYEDSLRCKTHSLFKLKNYDQAEKIMLDLIQEKHNSIYPYIELVDDFAMIGNLEKAKYYYDLGMKQNNLEDLDVLEERKNYFKK